MNILIIGAAGHTGALLLRLLSKHPHINAITATSSSKQGTPITDTFALVSNKLTTDHYIDIKDIDTSYDVIFSALPHGVTAPIYHTIIDTYNTTQNAKEANTSPSQKHTTSSQPLRDNTIQASHSLPVFIDLSADFRFDTIESYTQAYGNISQGIPYRSTLFVPCTNLYMA